MLFWIFVIVFIAAIVLDFKFDSLAAAVISVLSAFAIIISLGCFVAEHACVDATIAGMNTERDMLVYQYENDIYDNDNDLGKRELMVDIQEWNTTLARSRELQDNFWVGIYWADIYDQFEFIELE